MSVTSPNTRWNVPPPTYDAHSYMSSTLTPYLQLSHLLSLTWLAYPILSLAFVAFRLQLSLAASQDAVANAKGDLLTSCKAAEQAATAAASMPRFLAVATNQQFADAVNSSLNGARATLVLALTVMEAIINFIVDIYRSTLLCFLELVVRGGLAILIGAVQELNTLIQSVTNGLRTSIQSDITSANSAIKTAFDAINKVNPFSDINVPQIAVPSLDGLQNVTLPPTFQQALTNLNNSLPTFADLKDKIEAVIDTPFELLKKDINDTFVGLSFDSSTLPVPRQNLLSFCNDLDMSVVDDVGHDLIKIAKIGTIILVLLALLLIGLNCLLEWYKWRCMKAHLKYTRQAWMTNPTMHQSKQVTGAPQVILSDHNLLLLHASASHPLLTRFINNLSARLQLSPSQHTHLQWFFSYIFHPPALACLLIGLIGLLSVQIQLFAMGPLVAKYSDKSASTVSDFSNAIATSINNSMYSQSAAYANDVNGRVDAMQSTINAGVFGWVNSTTVTLNTTINEFYNDIQTAVSTVLNGTILDQPAQEFIRCLIGTKVDAIENALTFLHDNLKIDMPHVDQSVLVLSQASVDEATGPIAAAAIGGGTDDDQGLIGRLVNSYAASLKKERLMFAIFIALWGFVVLVALCIIFWHSYGKRLVEERKRRKWKREQRAGINGLVVPFRTRSPDYKGGVIASQDLPSFTPMPSPKGSTFKLFSTGRSPSPTNPKDKNEDFSHSAEPLEAMGGKSWGAFFGQAFTAASPSLVPTKFKAIGRKATDTKRFASDQEALREDSSFADGNDASHRNTAWFGRMAAMLGKKQPESEPESPGGHRNSSSDMRRPALRISIDRASSIGDRFEESATQVSARAPRSRWSASPEATQTMAPWRNLVVPPKKVSPHPPIGLPMRPKMRHNATVPSDVEHAYDASLIPLLKPTRLAPPIHHGFDSSSQSPRNASFPPQINLPQLYPSPDMLAPPPDRHRRTSSVPAWKTPKNDTNTNGSITPVTRLVTTTHARQSFFVNPFVTPFDDEHRVTIAHPNHTRKSIPTNPFNATAL